MTTPPPPVDYQTPRGNSDSGDLTAVDWLIIVLCSGIGCIIGIIRMIQGKQSGKKMLGFSLLFIAIWTVIRVVLMVGTGVR